MEQVSTRTLDLEEPEDDWGGYVQGQEYEMRLELPTARKVLCTIAGIVIERVNTLFR